MSSGKTRVWQRKKHDHMIANDRTVDVWLCLACGLAFPSDSRDLEWQTTVVFHRECLIAENRNQGQMKHIGMMSNRAASVLCGPRFHRELAPTKAPPPVLTTQVADRLMAIPALALSVVRNVDVVCGSCGETLVNGECPMNTSDWPHAAIKE